jgi:excinuclease ABC subunit B
VPHKPQRPDKVEGGKPFRIVSEYSPAGDQPGAIADLVATALEGEKRRSCWA